MIELPFPAKALWPNGRAHWAQKAREVKKHRGWAHALGKAEKISLSEGRYNVSIAVHPKTRHAIDADNAIASCKSYLDGIAEGMGVDDKLFNAPSLTFGEPIKGGLIRIWIRPE